MRLLLDTHVVLWAAATPDRLSDEVRAELLDERTELVVSAASLWEVSVTDALGRADFSVDVRILRRRLADAGWVELPVSAAHATAVRDLPDLHRDPFDRMLVAQARVEGIPLLTADDTVAAYGSPVRRI